MVKKVIIYSSNYSSFFNNHENMSWQIVSYQDLFCYTHDRPGSSFFDSTNCKTLNGSFLWKILFGIICRVYWIFLIFLLHTHSECFKLTSTNYRPREFIHFKKFYKGTIIVTSLLLIFAKSCLRVINSSQLI